MKKWLKVLTIGVALAWATPMFATKIGVVDMQQLMQASPQVKKINSTLMQEFSGRKKDIAKLGNQFRTDLQAYQKNKLTMSQTKLSELKAKLVKEEMQLRREQAKFQQDLFVAQNKHLTKFMNQIRGIVKTIANRDKLDLVLPTTAVLYAKSELDITDAVKSKLSE